MKNLREGVKRLTDDIKEYGWAGVVFLGYYLVVHVFSSAFCPMIQLTGLPCAGCGLTRAFLFLAQGQFARAAFINPMVFPIIAFLLYCGFFRYILGKKVVGFTLLFVLLVTGMLIFYGIRMYLYFPDRVPYVYAKDNVLASRVPGYEDIIQKLIQFLRETRK